VGRPAGAADINGAVAGMSVYHGRMPSNGGGLGRDVEGSGQFGSARVVAEEARALWTPSPSDACLVERRRRIEPSGACLGEAEEERRLSTDGLVGGGWAVGS
jgi:hypothetical protein